MDSVSNTKPTVHHFAEIACPVQNYRKKRSLDVTKLDQARGFRIAITNNGNVYSNESVMVVYNSGCQRCEIKTSSVSCSFTVRYEQLLYHHQSQPLFLAYLSPSLLSLSQSLCLSPFPSRNMYLYLSLSHLISLHHPFLTPYLASVYLSHNSPSLFFVFSLAIYFSHCISLSPFLPLYLSLFHWLFLSYISISHPPCSPSPFSL